MTHAPLFSSNVYIGTPWVLSHPVVIVVNKGPTMFCLVIASPLFGFGLVGCVLVPTVSLCVDVFSCTISVVVIFMFVRLMFM